MKIFVSFDFDNDRQYKYTLNMWASNANIDFSFNDGSTQEIQSWNISRIKAAITTKINQSDAILVLGIPIGFIALSVCKIVKEWSWISNLHYIDIIFLFFTSLYSLLYISNRMFHEEYFDVEAHPNLHFCTRLKRYFTN